MSEAVVEADTDTRPAPTPRSSRGQDGVGRGLRLLGSARLAVQIIQFASSIWLARLLTPSDYGVFAIIMTVAAFAGLLNDFGLTETLVRQTVLGRWQVDSAFWVNAFSGLLLAGLSTLISPLLAVLFDEPRLVYLFPLASLLFIISTNVVQIAVLQRHRHFALLAAAEVTNSLVLMTVTTVLAVLGAGVISLVAGLLSGAVVTAVVLWREVHWWPGRPRSRQIRIMLRSSSGNLGFSTLSLIGNTIDTYAVGIASSTAVLGAYNRAYNLSRMPTTVVGGVLGRVLLPVFADLRDDPAELVRTWTVYARRTLLLLAPVAAFISVFAVPLVQRLYGSQWTQSGSYLVLLAWVIPAFGFAGTLAPFLFLMARQRVVLGVGAAQAVVFVVAIGAGALAGTMGVVVGVVIASYVGHLPVVIVCTRLAKISRAAVRRALAAPLLGTLVLALVLMLIRVATTGLMSLALGAAGLTLSVGLGLVMSEPKSVVVLTVDHWLVRLGPNRSGATHRDSISPRATPRGRSRRRDDRSQL